MTYCSSAGKEIDLPLAEARSLAAQKIVQIIEDYKPELAYTTAEAAQRGKEQKVIKAKKR